MRSEEAEFLLKYPNANHLFMVMAFRARRTDHPMNGLKAGQCFLGDYSSIGMTRQQYRTAQEQLTNWNLATFKGTNKGTIGTIVNTKVYDINSDASNQQATIEQPTNNQPTTTNKECKKDKNERISDLFDADRIIPVWNSLGCARHKGLTKSAAKALDKTYKEYCKSANEPKELNDWLESYLRKGFKNWMTDHHRDLDNGQWCADLEFAVRFSTYDKIKNTVKK